jgi:hypothetical protein
MPIEMTGKNVIVTGAGGGLGKQDRGAEQGEEAGAKHAGGSHEAAGGLLSAQFNSATSSKQAKTRTFQLFPAQQLPQP